MIDRPKEIKQLYKDALYCHLLTLGYTPKKARFEVNKRFT